MLNGMIQLTTVKNKSIIISLDSIVTIGENDDESSSFNTIIRLSNGVIIPIKEEYEEIVTHIISVLQSMQGQHEETLEEEEELPPIPACSISEYKPWLKS